jgi:hypothetical protein
VTSTNKGLVAVLTILAVMLGAVGCGSGSGSDSGGPSEPPDPTAGGPAPATDFRATVTADGGALHVAYHLTNRSGAALLVLNRVPKLVNGATERDPDQVYVTGVQGTHTVQVAKRAFAQPPGVAFAGFAVVAGTLLAPGSSADEKLTVPFPLQRSYPYGDALADGTVNLPDPITTVQFCLGVLDPAQLQNAPSTGPDGSTTVVHSSAVTAVQHLLCSPGTKL